MGWKEKELGKWTLLLLRLSENEPKKSRISVVAVRTEKESYRKWNVQGPVPD